MNLINVRDLKGNEILAKDIMTWDYKIILPKGVMIRKEKKKKLIDLNITEVFVKDEEEKSGEIVILKSEMEESIKKTVKGVLERHRYHNNDELSSLSYAADEIITSIIEEEKGDFNMVSTDLKQVAKEIRGLTIECISSIGAGHIGGSMSIIDLLTVLYYKQMNIDPANPKMEGRDRLVVSKGHAGPAVYATLASKGYFPKSELMTLNKFNTNLPSHCDMNKTIGVDMTTGSLGQGISCGVGLALASKIKNDN